jgi:hypothetical protein
MIVTSKHTLILEQIYLNSAIYLNLIDFSSIKTQSGVLVFAKINTNKENEQLLNIYKQFYQ